MNHLTRILLLGVAALMVMMVAAVVVVNPAEAQPGPCGPGGCLSGTIPIVDGGFGDPFYGTPGYGPYGASGITNCGTRSVLAGTVALLGSVLLTDKMKNSTNRGLIIGSSTVGAGAIGCEFDKRAAQQAAIEAEVARRVALAQGTTTSQRVREYSMGRLVRDDLRETSSATRPGFSGDPVPAAPIPPSVRYEPSGAVVYPYGKPPAAEPQAPPQAKPQSHHEGAVLQELVLSDDPRPDLTANEPCGRYDGDAFQTCRERLRTRSF